MTTLLSTTKTSGLPKEVMGAPYSKNYWGLPEKKILSLANRGKWQGLPKTSNIDATLNYKNIGGSLKK